MLRIFFTFLLLEWCAPVTMNAQVNAQEITADLNKIMLLYSADDSKGFKLMEKIGMLEQVLNSQSVQRIKLAEINKISLGGKHPTYSVTLECNGNGPCISMVKQDMSTSSMSATAFLLSDEDATLAFGKKLEQLIRLYNEQISLLSGTSGSAGELNGKSQSENKAQPPSESRNTAKGSLKTEQEAGEAAEEETESTTKPVERARKTSPEQIERVEGPAKSRQKNKAQQEEDEDVETTEDPDEKKNKQRRRKSDNTDNIEDGNVLQANEPAVDRQAPALCRQIQSILLAGKNSGFKEIEGKETNPEKHIHESKTRLKGAQRNYLSWFKSKRAFIAEFRTLNDWELILEEFMNLQTQVEDCLEGAWEDTDYSGEEGAGEAKDIEYRLQSDPGMPTVRLLIHSQKEKHTLFIRIQ